jgi:hypothetical protein
LYRLNVNTWLFVFIALHIFKLTAQLCTSQPTLSIVKRQNEFEFEVFTLNPSSAQYFWNFGNGWYSTQKKTQTTYSASGVYTVSVRVTYASTCQTLKTETLNVTGVSCNGNAAFDILQSDTARDLTFELREPWNLSQGYWSWGDGAYSWGLLSSHMYTTSGVYQACLTATASCGDRVISCNAVAVGCCGGKIKVRSTYPSLKPNNDGTITDMDVKSERQVVVFPQPAHDVLNLKFIGIVPHNLCLSIFDYTGKQVYCGHSEMVNLTNFIPGMYTIQIQCQGYLQHQKILIQ